jgi:hypothetical protein
MNATEPTRFKPLYTAMLRALQLQGKADRASAHKLPFWP